MNSLQDKLNKAISQVNSIEVKSLLAVGASQNEPDSKGWTPLMQAAECSQAEIIDLLLRVGADVTKQGIENLTCLHIAVDIAIDGVIQAGESQGKEPTEIIEVLLNNGANVFAQDSAGKTPLDVARDYKSVKIMRLLEEHSHKKL